MLAAPALGPDGLVGFVIGKRQLPRAVDRNSLRRVLREAVRRRCDTFAEFDLLLRLKRPVMRAQRDGLAAEAETLLDALDASRVSGCR